MNDDMRWLTLIELDHLRLVGVIGEVYDHATVDFERATTIYDLNGEELFARVPIVARDESQSYVDVALQGALGEPLLGIAPGAFWDSGALLDAGLAAAKDAGLIDDGWTEVRFVAYSYPKLALQILRADDEVALVELYTWAPVPAWRRDEEQFLPPSNFERWSYLDELPDELRDERIRHFDARVERWRNGIQQAVLDPPRILPPHEFELLIPKPHRFIINRSRQLHYSSRLTDHEICYELRGQQTSVWCVGASVQMLLDFYRYEYTQVRLAVELGLGTLTNPNGLPYARVNDVVTVIEALSSGALDATINSSPTWAQFESEINANRPLISFIPGHSRTVAGYTRSLFALLGQPPFRGLLVFDPWPPNAGVITRWETFNTQIYQFTYTARVQLA